jgi:hypothetical protein
MRSAQAAWCVITSWWDPTGRECMRVQACVCVQRAGATSVASHQQVSIHCLISTFRSPGNIIFSWPKCSSFLRFNILSSALDYLPLGLALSRFASSLLSSHMWYFQPVASCHEVFQRKLNIFLDVFSFSAIRTTCLAHRRNSTKSRNNLSSLRMFLHSTVNLLSYFASLLSSTLGFLIPWISSLSDKEAVFARSLNRIARGIKGRANRRFQSSRLWLS